jgi:hypothetical protein
MDLVLMNQMKKWQNKNKMTRGGKREGAGAKKLHPVNAKRRQIPLTDEEYQKVKEYVKMLRGKKE